MTDPPIIWAEEDDLSMATAIGGEAAMTRPAAAPRTNREAAPVKGTRSAGFAAAVYIGGPVGLTLIAVPFSTAAPLWLALLQGVTR